MTKRIFRSILAVSLAVLLASSLLIVGVLHGYFQDSVLADLTIRTAYIAHGIENEGIVYLEEDLPGGCHITLVDTDGTVLYDNREDPAQMENHADREEIHEAAMLGQGRAVRHSDTLSEKTIYYALRLSDGTILRVSDTEYSVWRLVIQAMQPMALVLVLAFVLGLGMAYTHSVKFKGVMDEFKGIIERVIGSVIIPLLPFYIFGIFLSMTRSGQVAGVLGVFVKLIAVIFCMTVVLLLVQFSVAGLAARKNPLRMLRTMLAAYVTALGTQSSAATIPVTLAQTLKLGVRPEIASFVVPLCATIHLSGSMMKIVACALAVSMIAGLELPAGTFVGFILLLAVTMIAAPGVPGGAIMAALGLLESMLGFDETLAGLMIATYIAMDSFGTATNVTGDGAVAVIVDAIDRRR